jgi:hypothetical protein
MVLNDEGPYPHIFWEIEYDGDEDEPDEVCIGLEIEHPKKVIGYEGVMGMSDYALDLLRKNGYDVSEIED